MKSMPAWRSVIRMTGRASVCQWLVIPILLFTPTLVWAGGGAASAAPISAGQIFRVFGGLGLVLALLFVGLWLFKRFGGTSLRPVRGNLRILSSLPLGNRARLLLVEAGGVQFLIGVSAQRVELLGRIDAAPDSEPPPSRDAVFMERLMQSLQQGKTTEHEQENSVTGTGGGNSSRHD